MPRPSIHPILQRFVQAENRITDLISRSANLYEIRNGGFRVINSHDRYSIIEIHFLRLMLEWEFFIEESFTRFLCGGLRTKRPQPHLLAKFKNLENAKDALHGKQGFVGWINPEEIIRQSKLYFRNGEPYISPIQAATKPLNEARIIRNRIAHFSDKAEEQFSKMIREKYGYSPRGMTPGRFLLDKLPQNSLSNEYSYYTQILITVGQIIIG